jgi:hypothetical protein
MALLTATLTHGNFGLTIKDVTGNTMQIEAIRSVHASYLYAVASRQHLFISF